MKKEKEENAFYLIKERYFQLDNDFDRLITACNNEEEKKQLRQDYIIARANYRKGLNLSFELNDPIVKDLTKKLGEIENRIKKDIEGLEIASNIFKMISESVKIASSIIVLVMSLV